MKFIKTKLKDVYIIEPQKRGDARGYFARIFCKKEFSEQGLTTNFVQSNTALSKVKGTFRGMHFQKSPYSEVKVVRCTKGALFDVVIDLRKKSPTYKKWLGIELSEENCKMLYIPKGFAHGYITLKNNTEIFYMVSQFYTPEAEGGVRFNDPAFAITWPTKFNIISEKDKSWENFTE